MYGMYQNKEDLFKISLRERKEGKKGFVETKSVLPNEC